MALLTRRGLGETICHHCGANIPKNGHTKECFVNIPAEHRNLWKLGKYDAEHGIAVCMNKGTAEGRAYHNGRACAHLGEPTEEPKCPAA